jgi:hypothetical protein
MRWTRQRFARDGVAGRVERLVSDHRHADERCCCGRQNSCGPDAPTLASSSRSCVGPTGLRQNISAGDGGKRARSPGRARHKPLKPLRAGMPGDSGVLVYSCAFYQCKAHTRLRVQRAPGVPHALERAEDFMHSSGASRRGVANVYLELFCCSKIVSGIRVRSTP